MVDRTGCRVFTVVSSLGWCHGWMMLALPVVLQRLLVTPVMISASSCVTCCAALKPFISLHANCRNAPYPGTSISRFPVPDDKVRWTVPWKDYSPADYTSSRLTGASYADPPVENAAFVEIKFNQLDGGVDRRSFITRYDFSGKLPLNPIGRTGITGRGRLGRWGPNHAADPIVTRWKRDDAEKQSFNEISGKPILQFVAILRRDCGEWAIPGGMVDPGECISMTLKREFFEEAFNCLKMSEKHVSKTEKLVKSVFDHGVKVYEGYVDDPRNTDNAWIETVAVNFHDHEGALSKVELKSGDDAANVRWVNISKDLKLYASHIILIEAVARLHDAHW